MTRRGFDSEISAQCLEMGQLVLSSSSWLMSGGRKFKSDDTGFTVCFQQTGHKEEGYGEKHQKRSAARVM